MRYDLTRFDGDNLTDEQRAILHMSERIKALELVCQRIFIRVLEIKEMTSEQAVRNVKK